MQTRVFTELRDTYASLFSNQVDQERIAHEVLTDKSVIRFSESSKNVWHDIIVEAERQNRVLVLFTCPSIRSYLRNPNLIFCELLWLASQVEWDLNLLKQIYEEVALASSSTESTVFKSQNVVDILLLSWELDSKTTIVQCATHLVNETNNSEISSKLREWVSKAQVTFRNEIRLQPIDQPQKQIETIKEKSLDQQADEQKIDDWLKQFGFDHNPFAYSNSEYNARLSEYFVEHSDFKNTVSLNHHLIFAGTGDGKTAMRLGLQARYRDALLDDNYAFAFSYLIPQEIIVTPPQSIDGHFQSLLTAAVHHAFVFFALRGMEFPSLQTQVFVESLAPQLIAFFNEYYVPTANWQDDLRKALSNFSLMEVLEKLAPVYDALDRIQTGKKIDTDWLLKWLTLLSAAAKRSIKPLSPDLDERWSDFRNLIKEIGIKQMIILVDEVRLPSTNGSRNVGEYDSVQHMESVVMPLLKAVNDRLWGEKVYWKFFLPLELYLPLIGPRSPDIPHVILGWDHLRLKEMLDARLITASGGTIKSLDQLVVSSIRGDLEKYLFILSGVSPRHLIHNIHNMFAFHINGTKDVPGKISHASLSKMRWRHRL